jgi:protein-disulfide isomerase
VTEEIMPVNQNKLFFEKLSPKTSFFLGLAGSIMLLFIVGFFVLLFAVFGDDFSSSGRVRAENTDAKVRSQGQPSAPSGGDNGVQLAAITDDDWVRGSRDAAISIVEFSDLDCPFCQSLHPTLEQVIAQYGQDVNWVYKHFPLTSIHPTAQLKAEAAECAGEQGGNDGFWAYTDLLFERQSQGKTSNQLAQFAGELGLNSSTFEACLNSGKFKSKVQEQSTQAAAAGGRGTPYSVIVAGDQTFPVSGAVPIAQFQTVIDSLL